jgi:hypothetical protein
LRYAVRSPAGAWSVTDVHWELGYPTYRPVVSLAVGPGDQPHIVFSLGDCWTNLLYATRTGGQWSVEQVVGSCSPATVAVDANGVPHVAYYQLDGIVVYARREAGGWVSEAVSGGVWPSEDAPPSIALDAQGRPSISYRGTGGLRVATRSDGGGWTSRLVDTEAGVGDHSSLRVDAQGLKHVAYSRANGALKYAVGSAGDWTLETLLAGGDVGRHPSLVLNESGNPRIACLAGDRHDLLYFARPLEPEQVVGVEGPAVPSRFSATGPWPNPVRADAHCQLALELPAADRVAIALYDLAGRRVAAQSEAAYPAGRHVVRLRVGTLDPGVYFLRVRAEHLGLRTLRVVATR